MAYYVYELCSDDSLPRYIGVGKHGERCSWQLVWEQRAQWPGALAAWLRSLPDKPVEKVLLGKATGLTAKEARAIARARIRQVNAYATGSENQQASFLTNQESFDPSPRGKQCALLVDGEIQTFPSVSAAGRACGVARETIGRQVRQGRLSRRRRRAATGAPANI